MPPRLSSASRPPCGAGSSSPTDRPVLSPSSPSSSPSRYSLGCPGYLSRNTPCDYHAIDPTDMVNHIIDKHNNKLEITPDIRRDFSIADKYICPGCHIIFKGRKKHLQGKKCSRKYMTAADAIDYLRSPASSSSSSASRAAQRHPRPPPILRSLAPDRVSEHPLPLFHPRIWERVPPSLQTRFINILRPGLMAYSRTTDLEVKARIFAGLLAAINQLLRKVRGNGGKALSSLTHHLTHPTAADAIFAEWRHIQPSPLAPVRPVDVDIWVDGSSKHVKGRSLDDRKGETGIGIVVVDYKNGPDPVDHLAYLGTGTNNTSEVSAMIFALELFQDRPLLKIRIWSDSTFALGAAGTAAVQPMHRNSVDRLRLLIRSRTPRAVFVKADAHAGVPNNERADMLAKKARTDLLPHPPPGSFLALRAVPTVAASNIPVDIIPGPLPPRPPPAPSPAPSVPVLAPLPSQSAIHDLPATRAAADVLRTNVRCAVGKVRLGYVGAAVDLLSRAPLADLNEQQFQHLKSLHPTRDPSHIILEPPGYDVLALPPPLDDDAIVKIIKSCDRGKSPGPSNLTAGHLRVLISDPDCLRGVCDMVRDIAAGNLAQAAVDLVTAAISVPIPKGADQVRPLAVPEVLYKVPTLLLLESVNHLSQVLFPKIQFACGVPNGMETAIHRTQIALERGGPGSDTIVLSLDARNAFNERQRTTMAEALFKIPETSRLWRAFMTFYGNRHSHLGVYSRGELVRHFMSSEGVKQGDPLAMFFYCLSVQPLYESTVAGDEQLEAVAFADDFTITGPSVRVIAALRRMIVLCEPNGPTLNMSKCKALWAYSRQHPNYLAFSAAMCEFGIPVVYDSIPLLGASVGLGMHRSDHAMKVAKSHGRLFDAVVHEDMPAQIGHIILQQSGRRLGHHARAYPPAMFRAAAEFYDQLVVNTVAKICDLPAPGSDPNILQAIQLSYRNDGMNFRPYTRESPSAHLASIARSARDIARGHVDIASAIRGTDFEFHLNDTYEMLRKGGIDSASKEAKPFFPPTFADFWSFFTDRPARPHLQYHIGRLLEVKWSFRQPTILPPTELAPLPDDGKFSVKRDPLALFWTTLPTSRSTNIENRYYRLAIRHIYGFPVASNLPSACECGASLVDEPSHWHSCRKTRKRGCGDRHEYVADELIAQGKAVGMVINRIPALRDVKGKRTQPDFEMDAHHSNVFVDVSICSAYAKTNIALPNPIATREQQKIEKYEDTCRDNSADFLPFVLDSLGRFGPGAWRVIDLIVSHHNNHTTAHEHDPKLHERITRAIAVQLQRGNGRVDHRALQLHRISNPRPRSPHPLQRAAPPPPPITHITLLQAPAAPDLIPSIRDAWSSSSSPSSPRRPLAGSSSVTTSSFIDPNIPESKEEKLPVCAASSSDDDDEWEADGTESDCGSDENDEDDGEGDLVDTDDSEVKWAFSSSTLPSTSSSSSSSSSFSSTPILSSVLAALGLGRAARPAFDDSPHKTHRLIVDSSTPVAAFSSSSSSPALAPGFLLLGPALHPFARSSPLQPPKQSPPPQPPPHPDG
jgi:ribonuclease HI